MNLPARWCLLGLLTLTVVAALMRAPATWQRPLWFDESDTWQAASPDTGITYAQFFTWTNHFENAPLGFLLPRIATDLLGTQAEWAWRLPALIFGLLCIPAMYWLGRVVHSHFLGLMTALLIAFDPTQFDQSQQARMYPMLMLFTILAACCAILILRDPTRRHWHWVVLGVALGLSLWSTLLGAMVWVSIALGAAALLIVGWLTGRPHAQFQHILLRFTLAYVAAIAVANVGVYRIIARAINPPDRGGAGMPVPAIARELVVGLKDMIWPNSSAADLPLSLLITAVVLTLATIGLARLAFHCKTSTAVMLGLLVGTAVMMIPFRRAHRFMDPRYFTVLQPALWIGLGMLAMPFARAKGQAEARSSNQIRNPKSEIRNLLGPWPLALILVMLYITAQAWQCWHIDRWWAQPDRYLVVPALRQAAQQRGPGDVIAVAPPVVGQLARYYDIPVDAALDAALRDPRPERNYQPAPDPRISADFAAPSTWLVIGMVNDLSKLQSANAFYPGKPVAALAAHYGLTLDPAELQGRFAKDRVIIAHISPAGIQWTMLER
ncbi:MAG: glycosyltransferase family 39 protein [Phycisphaeraceae bacterium]